MKNLEKWFASVALLFAMAISGCTFKFIPGADTAPPAAANLPPASNKVTQGGDASRQATAFPISDYVWIDDALPAGSQIASSGGDNWNWVQSGPAPFSGFIRAPVTEQY